MATYTEIDPELLFAFLTEHGYSELELPGVRERVFGKRRDRHFQRTDDNPETEYYTIPLTVRVYTTVAGPGEGTQRDCGEDAIRVSLVTARWTNRDIGEPQIVKGFARVHRVKGWKKNLAARLAEAEEFLVLPCPQHCGGLLLERSGKFGKFLGCSRYPVCKATMQLPTGD